MNDLTKQLIYLSSLSMLSVFLIYLFSRKKNKTTSNSPQIKSEFKKGLVQLANKEWDKWNKNGVIKEGSKDTIQDLRNYWEEGANVKKDDSYYTKQAWSSAFISYIMRLSGAGDDFKYSSSHSQYIAQAIKNKKENNSKKFKGYKPDEVNVEIGDLVCFPRQKGITYNSEAGYKSHCDLITEINGDVAVGIGGNISNSVTKSNYYLKNNKIDKSKDKKSFGGIFTVIKNLK